MKNNKDQEIKVGSYVLIEQAWEDERGDFHDEDADVLKVNDDGTVELKWLSKDGHKNASLIHAWHVNDLDLQG